MSSKSKQNLNPKKRDIFKHAFFLRPDSSRKSKQVYLIPSWSASSEIQMNFESDKWTILVDVPVGTHKYKYAYRDIEDSVLWMEDTSREFTEDKAKRLLYPKHEDVWNDSSENMKLENLLDFQMAIEIVNQAKKKRLRKTRKSSKKRRALKRRSLEVKARDIRDPSPIRVRIISRSPSPRARSTSRSVVSPRRSSRSPPAKRSRWDSTPSPVRRSRWDSPVRSRSPSPSHPAGISPQGRKNRSISRSRSRSPKRVKTPTIL